MLENNEVHLWDLNDKVYIKIKDECRKDFFNAILKVSGSVYELAGLMGKSSMRSFRKYERGEVSIPLKLVRKMICILGKDQKNLFENLIECNLTEVKFGLRKAKPIRNPSFPIYFSPLLSRVCGHLVGDGGINDKDFDCSVYYTNQSDHLINQFRDDILTVFGDVEFKIFSDKRDSTKSIKFPSIVGLILTTMFGEQIRELKHVPDLILQSDKISKAFFLKSLYDDEGSMREDGIQLIMSNENVIRVAKEILRLFDIKPGKTQISQRENCKTQFGFCICSGTDLDIFNKEIGFDHPKKREKLQNVLKGYKYFKRRRGEFVEEVISSLKANENINIFNLANILNQKSINGFRKELWKLERKGLIKSRMSKGKLNRNIKLYYI